MGGLASPPSPTIGVLTSEGAVLEEVAEVAAAAAVMEVCNLMGVWVLNGRAPTEAYYF